jgi:peroxiredoxin
MKVFITLFAFFPAILFAQPGKYVVEGKISGSKVPVKAYLIHNSGTVNKIDSVPVVNGVFTFRGTVTEPQHANLILDHTGVGLDNIDPRSADMINFYLEKGILSLKMADSVFKATITGSPLNEDFQKLKNLLKPVTEKFNNLIAEYNILPPDQQYKPEIQASFEEKYKTLEKEQKQLFEKYIHNNPGKLTSLDALMAYGGEEPNVNEVEPLFKTLSATVKKTGAAKSYAASLEKFRVTAVGSLAPDFVQNDPDGKPVKLSSFRGKYLLLDFWASWCGPCREENPNIVQVYNQYKDKNFTILGVSLDRDGSKASWLNAIKNDKLTWTQVSDLKFWQNAVVIQYGIKAIPQNLLLDPQGKIIAKNLRGEELRKKLAELLDNTSVNR